MVFCRDLKKYIQKPFWESPETVFKESCNNCCRSYHEKMDFHPRPAGPQSPNGPSSPVLTATKFKRGVKLLPAVNYQRLRVLPHICFHSHVSRTSTYTFLALLNYPSWQRDSGDRTGTFDCSSALFKSSSSLKNLIHEWISASSLLFVLKLTCGWFKDHK